MNTEALEYLSKMPHFSMLPEEEIRHIAERSVEVSLSKGTRFADQGQTRVDSIFVVTRGALALYNEKENTGKPTGYIKSGEVFGGITILLNAGISLRTVVVNEECSGYKIPEADFQDLCTRYKAFYEYFLANFSKNIFDPSLSTVIETGQTRHFLSDIEPFSFLPPDEIERIVSQLSIVHYTKDTVLFVQGSTRVGYLYILHKGSAEKYFEENHQKVLSEMLGEGDIYGGISMLLNDGISTRNLKILEDTYCYLMPRDLFMDVCGRHEAFTDYFTNIFGKRMLQKSYAAIVAKTMPTGEEGGQFFNQHVAGVYSREPVFCDMSIPIQEAARHMKQSKASSVFLKGPDGKCVGVVTERDLARRVVASGYDTRRPVSEIMSAPVRTIPEYAFVSEAFIAMLRQDIRHIAVTDDEENVIGLLTNHDLLTAQGQSPFFLLRDIAEAQTLAEIIDRHNQLPKMVRALISSGARATNVNRIITMASDTILNKLMAFALDQTGPPPVRFAFMILGSEGRREQTLKTDQDNAIIFEDVPPSDEPAVKAYFLNLGEKICTLLDQAGYDFCTGGVMAKNPRWCQPARVWKEYFSTWIHTAEAEDLLQASIFFDFRTGYGDTELVESLRTHLFSSLGGWSGFFRHLTENALYFKPPLGFFRNFVVESRGQHQNAFDIKSAMTPIVDFARIYALKNKVAETNTLDRLLHVRQREVLTAQEYEELEKAYGFLMQLRFIRQVTAVMDEKAKPDNYINPKKMTRIEQKMLKEIFTRIGKFQTKLEFAFIGVV